MLTSMYSAVSGMNANGTSLSVIGDNIANLNTVGFKGSRATFGDVLAGSVGALQIGRGVLVSGVSPLFTQGSFETTANALDLGIEGDGFFIVNEGGANYYTRAGYFSLDKDGFIVNPDGLILQGYLADTAGNITGTIEDLRIESRQSLARATTNSTIALNLDSQSAAQVTPFTLDGNGDGPSEHRDTTAPPSDGGTADVPGLPVDDAITYPDGSRAADTSEARRLTDVEPSTEARIAVVAGQPARVELAGGIVVSVPGEAITASGSLSVQRLSFSPAVPVTVGELVAGFAIELPGQPASAPLKAPATITFTLDPARLRADVPAAEAAWVVSWDGRSNDLVEEPAVVDAVAGTVTVHPMHFSSWWLYVFGPGDVYGTSPHFTFRFPAAINVNAWGTTDPFQVMARVRSKLEAYHDAYVAAGFAAPANKIPVRLMEALEAGYDPLNGDIVVSSFNYTSDATMLEHELAHELFHAFQAAQLNLFSLDARRWFVEATADYAADALAAHSGRMGKDIDATWSWYPLGLVDGKHEYATSHFIAWLVARGKSFATLHKAVFDAWLTTDAGESAFATAAAGPGGFAATFRDYILWLETSPQSPLASKPFSGFSVSDLFSTTLPLDALSSTTPKLAAFTAAWTAGEEHDLLWEAPPAGVDLNVRVLRGGSRASVEEPTTTYTTLKPGDAMLFLASGEAPSEKPILIQVEPAPKYVQFSIAERSGNIPSSDARGLCSCKYNVVGSYTLPYGTEQIAMTTTSPCAVSASGASPPVCFAVELVVRQSIPGRIITWWPSLSGGGSCSFPGLCLSEGMLTVRDGQPYTNASPFRIPASGGATSIWSVARCTETTDTGEKLSHEDVLAELQIRVSSVL